MKPALIRRSRSRELLLHPNWALSDDVAGMAAEIERLHARLKLERKGVVSADTVTINLSADADPEKVLIAFRRDLMKAAERYPAATGSLFGTKEESAEPAAEISLRRRKIDAGSLIRGLMNGYGFTSEVAVALRDRIDPNRSTRALDLVPAVFNTLTALIGVLDPPDQTSAPVPDESKDGIASTAPGGGET